MKNKSKKPSRKACQCKKAT